MRTRFRKPAAVLLGLALPLVVAFPQQTYAQDDGEEAIEEIITTGTRVADRSAADSPVAVDVIGGRDNLRVQIDSDLADSVV